MLALLVAAVVASASPAAAGACGLSGLSSTAPYAVGERLSYAVDSLGATIGTLRLTVVPGPPGTPVELQARGATGTFAANFYPVKAVARSRLSGRLADQSYSVDATENGVHRTIDVTFPPRDGLLAIRASEEGNRRDYRLRAAGTTLDLLAALYQVRGLKLANGTSLCLQVFAVHHLWTVRAEVRGREKAHTPAGDFETIHLSGAAVRNDNPKDRRPVEFWFSDDAQRLPVAACGTVQQKPVCANLTSFTRP